MPPPAQTPNYQHSGAFDRAVFGREFSAQFGRSARYNAAAVPDMMLLVGLIEADSGITDVRQAAYMLATVMWETTSPVKVSHVARNKKGQPLLDKQKKPVIVTQRKWLMTMAPVSEIGQGKGRKYHEPVKVKRLADGSVRITEQDGDQFSISAAGVVKPLTKKAKMGTVDGGAASKVYEDDDGDELAYYGRGYVQLTWWSNYAAAGVAIGRGLDLLLDPELVKSPEVAYALMSHGMRTGEGFANGHKFSHYFVGQHTKYREARRMVNGSDHAEDIAALARKFEAILLAARVSTEAPVPLPLQLERLP
ncbi:MAG: glycoside hydrolase [Burkholderiales bacterium]|nr:glycoside hydrolase [Burkholderiales bacterium]